MRLLPDNPIAGVLAPLFALRSGEDLGIGDLGALREFVDWAHGIGFRLVQLLPVNETGNDHSPYNAISSVALDPATLETTPQAIPDLIGEDYRAVLAGVDLAALRNGPVNYSVVKPLKRRLLEKAFEVFNKTSWRYQDARAVEFHEWRESQAAWLEGYSLFRALMDHNGGSEMWDRWPLEQRTAASALHWLRNLAPGERAGFEAKRRFFEYVQWIAFGQWEALRIHCEEKGVALMGDVPIGVSYYGADVFTTPEIFNLGWSGGAPPEHVFRSDPFTEKWGQNWGVPMYRWNVLEQGGFTWWRQRVACVRGIFHLFRIDHILGFYRMYGFPWRPQRNGEFLPLSDEEAKALTGGALPHFIPRDDSTSENREANCRDGEEYLRVLLEEAGEYRLVGEDLGQVPDYVRPNLASLGIAGFKIPQWERRHDGRLISGSEYQRLSVATYATHDHPPLAALWTAMYDAARAGDGHQRWELEMLGAYAGIDAREPIPFSPEVHERLLEALFRCNSWIAVAMVTDLFATAKRFNVPGAVADSNWSERLGRTPAEWLASEEVSEKMRRITQILERSGRIP